MHLKGAFLLRPELGTSKIWNSSMELISNSNLFFGDNHENWSVNTCTVSNVP